MSGIRFTKMQGVGNDFMVVDGLAYPSIDWPALAIRACQRHTGIGADGLLVVDSSDRADVRMRMFNPDGTPDVCGNGMRCVARWAIDHRRAESAKNLTIETLAGIRTAHRPAGSDDWTVEMGAPQFEPAQIPMRADSGPVIDVPITVCEREIRVTAISTGTTHAVVFVDSLPDDDTFFFLSPAIEHHALFPERTSVMWTRLIDSDHSELRILERGAGETWGCGTGACAAAVASILQKRASNPVSVTSKGGILKVDWTSGEEILLTGPAERVFEGVISH